MILEIPDILNPSQLQQIAGIYQRAEWSDGKASAGSIAKAAKSNREIKSGTPEHRELAKIVMVSLAENTEVEMAMTPVGSSIPIFSKYTEGMFYPEHLDEPMVSYKNPNGSIFPARFRADISATIFLSNPDDYEGGELLIKSPYGDQTYKGAAGSMVTYPSNFVHEITPVSGGERRVAVLWFQSQYGNPEERMHIYHLRKATRQLIERYPDDDNVKRVHATTNSLIQLFSR